MSAQHGPPPIREQKEGGNVSSMDSHDFDIFKGEGHKGQDVELDEDELEELAETKQRQVEEEERRQKQELKRRQKELKKQRKLNRKK